MKIICFEDEPIIPEKSKFFYTKGENKIKTVTIGKEYFILSSNNGLIKLKNDRGFKYWYTPDRFLYSLKMERKEKLQKIKNDLES